MVVWILFKITTKFWWSIEVVYHLNLLMIIIRGFNY